ncbi:MAG: FimB/Mfa2 family fimbrial subunit [Muribaculaceae bacterium]|nr:FimB/Mfa2 family fimbrial subunit [Muribaculaceae bacterium]
MHGATIHTFRAFTRRIFRDCARTCGIVCMPLLAAALASCSLDDDRDLCCDPSEGTLMNYRYLYLDKDVFPQYIKDMDHYLFDSEGNFMERLAPGADLQKQDLHLAPGTYTMVSIGNRDGRQSMEGHAEEGLSGFVLRARSQNEMRSGDDGEEEKGEEFHIGELYGGFCRFTVHGNRFETFLTDMSNIHCQLDMRVVWETAAPTGNFKIELANVPSHYILDYDRKNTYNGYDFPADRGMRDSYSVTVPQMHQQLETTFVTLRYTSWCVPTVKIFNDTGQQITPDIDLERAFQSWGWIPENMTVQHYRIIIEIRANGSVLVRPWMDGNVLDWVLGEIF